MHAIGGLYLDIDVECFMPTDRLLSGRDVVLQLEDATPKSLNNAVMASVPGHPFWLKVMQLMLDRGGSANDTFLGYRDLGTILKTTGMMRSCSERAQLRFTPISVLQTYKQCALPLQLFLLFSAHCTCEGHEFCSCQFGTSAYIHQH